MSSYIVEANMAFGSKQKMKALSKNRDILLLIDEALSRESERERKGEMETLVDSEGNEYVLERTEKRSRLDANGFKL